MGNSDSLADPVKFRSLISTGCPPVEHRQGSPAFIVVWLPLRVTPVTPGVPLSGLAVFVKIDAPVFPFVGEGRQLHCAFRGYIQVRLRRDPQVCSAPLWSLCQETQCFRLPFTPPSSYVGELPNSHGRTLTDKSYVLHGMPYKSLLNDDILGCGLRVEITYPR
jgi:hypothetical protein